MMKKFKKIKGLSIVEVMIFFLVTSVILILTIPAVTTRTATSICTPGGQIIFDGTENVRGDVSGLVKMDCQPSTSRADEKICTYLWRSPVKYVHVTAIGAGGGGSGAIIRDGKSPLSSYCNKIKAAGYLDGDRCNTTSDRNYVPAYSVCAFDTLDDATDIGALNFADSTKINPSSMFFMKTENTEDETETLTCSWSVRKDFVDKLSKAGVTGLNGLKTAAMSDILDNPTSCDATCKIMAAEGDTNSAYLCSLDDDGKEYVGGTSFCSKIEEFNKDFDVPLVIGGAGGTGGFYTFGPTYKSGRDGYYYEYIKTNLARQVSLSTGEVYKIIVGEGGAGGKAFVTDFEAMDSDIDYLQDYSGHQGGRTCFGEKDIPACNAPNIPDTSYFVDVSGGDGAAGYIPEHDGIQITIADGVAEHLLAYYTSPFIYDNDLDRRIEADISDANLDDYIELKSKCDGLKDTECKERKQQDIEHSAVTLRDSGYHPKTIGLPGSIVAPGKGGPSLYGIDRAGSGGDGGYITSERKKELTALSKSKPDYSEGNGKAGQNGLLEIRWFTTCE